MSVPLEDWLCLAPSKWPGSVCVLVRGHETIATRRHTYSSSEALVRLAAALASTSIDGVSGTGLDPEALAEALYYAGFSQSAEWARDRKRRHDTPNRDFRRSVATVLRAALAKDSPSRA